MSDYTNSNVSRSEGVSAKGLIITVLVLVALLFVMSLFGGGGTPATEGEEGMAVQPLATEPTPAAPAVIE